MLKHAVKRMPGQPPVGSTVSTLSFRWDFRLKGQEACITGFDAAVTLSALDNGGGGRERDPIREGAIRARHSTVSINPTSYVHLL